MIQFANPTTTEPVVEWIAPASIHEEHFLENGLKIVRINACGPFYEELLCLRGGVLGVDPATCVDPVDEHSNLYVMYRDEQAIGALRVPLASDGPVDCEEFYPVALTEQYRDKLISASGFYALPDLDPGLRVARLLVEAAWLDVPPTASTWV